MTHEERFKLARAKLHSLLKARQAERANELDRSRQLDVHTWSDHPEANQFVNAIYDAYFEGQKKEIKKKHVKVVLLDLYVAWCQDPDLKIAYSRNVNDYDAGSRYNALNISKLTITVADRLVEAGLILQAKGFKDRETGRGRISRIWPTHALIAKFKEARFGPLDVGRFDGEEVIVLRDGKKEIPYEDTSETERMRRELNSYNALLRTTFIDIPVLKESFIELEAKRGDQTSKLHIGQKEKFVRRIFNRGSFEKGGRFSGGWWQRCPKEWRSKIFINDNPTSEIDYSGLHIVMLYAEKGIDYWAEVGSDPYAINRPDFLETEEQTRSVAKRLLLMSLNADNETEAFAAFRDQAARGSWEKKLTNKQLGRLFQALKEKHLAIEDRIASDAGIDLMNGDSQITEKIIQTFTVQSIPILTVHDSYIVPCGQEEALESAMQRAFKEVTGTSGTRLKEETKRPEAILNEHFQRRAMDLRNPALNSLMGADYDARVDPSRSERYQLEWSRFREWADNQVGPS